MYIIGIQYFGKSALKSMKIGVPNMDVLIFIGSSAAFFIVSTVGGIFMHQVMCIIICSLKHRLLS